MKKIALFLISIIVGTISMFADVVPASYPGGDKAMNEFIKKNIKYPEQAYANGIEGVVSVGFIVHTDGTIGTIKIIRMVDPDLEQEAIRIVKIMPKWNPATDNGVAIESQAEVSIPFSFE